MESGPGQELGNAHFPHGQPVGRRVVRSALGWDAFHPGILDAHLLLNKEELLGEPGDPSSAVIRGISLSAGSGQGESGDNAR